MEVPLKGSIKDISLVKILVNLNRTRATGTLSLTTSVCTRKIYLHTGDVIFASSTYEDDRLGEMLLKAGKITIEQYDRSVEVLKATKKRQGAILVELGYLTPKDLFWAVKYQVAEIVNSMFFMEDALYEFIDGEPPLNEVITLKMSMGNLIYTGVSKIVNWTKIRNEMPHTDSIMKLSDDPLTLFQDIELNSQDRKILSLIDGKRTIKYIIDNSLMGSFDALKVFYILWSIGMIEEIIETDKTETEEGIGLHDMLEPVSVKEEIFLKRIEDVYVKLDTIAMHELLEIDENTDSIHVRKNYYRLAREFHPDRYFSSSDLLVKMKLATIFDAINEAYNRLKDDNERRDYFRILKNA